jgi:leucyl/phenylalanyl-tRNA--protein transferase
MEGGLLQRSFRLMLQHAPREPLPTSWAHSVEAWDAEGLAGGLYGVAIGGLFAAESMFFRRSGASKAAFLGLVALLREAGGERLLDVQWLTSHLASLGAVEVPRAEYHRRLDGTLGLPDVWQRTV